MLFQNRLEAGSLLAKQLKQIALRNPLVLGLPHGGVPVAFEIAHELRLPLDVIIVRKWMSSGVGNSVVGAIAEDGEVWFESSVSSGDQAKLSDWSAVIAQESERLVRQVNLYRGLGGLPDFSRRSVIIVDDGVVSGVTARVAGAFAKRRGAQELIFAVPVCPLGVAKKLPDFDRVVCLEEKRAFSSVAHFYQNFPAVSDQEIIHLLQQAKHLNGEEKVLYGAKESRFQ